MNKLIEDAHENVNEKIDQIKCKPTEVKSNILGASAKSFHESTKLLSLIAEN